MKTLFAERLKMELLIVWMFKCRWISMLLKVRDYLEIYVIMIQIVLEVLVWKMSAKHLILIVKTLLLVLSELIAIKTNAFRSKILGTHALRIMNADSWLSAQQHAILYSAFKMERKQQLKSQNMEIWSVKQDKF